MHLPRFWAREIRYVKTPSGKGYDLVIWGWSDLDIAGARQMALQRIAVLARKVEMGSQLNRYGYGEGGRPLREPLIAPVPGAEALISRNAYGALVLNTARVFFADIDLPEPPSPGLLGALFGKKKPTDPAEAALARLREWHARQPGWALRIYRTKAGLRLLATHDLFDPVSGDTHQLLTGLGSDPLYTALCRSQACFRARLTPKPWRMGLSAPTWRYPFEAPVFEKRFNDWLQRYDAARQRYNVCRLLDELGPRSQTPEAAAVVAVHDRYACSPGDLPLA